MFLNACLSLLALFYVHPASAAQKDFRVNQDVFVCGSTVKSIVSTEFQFFTGHNLEFPKKFDSVEAGIDWLIQDITERSPSRSRLLEFIFKNSNGFILLKKGIEVQRVSVSSNRILPNGCEVTPLSILTLSANPAAPAFSAVINQDLLEKLSTDDQLLVWWELALDTEQALFEFEKSRNLGYEIEFDLVRSKDFIECWLDLKCKPNDTKSFHQFALYLKLDYLEQSEFLVPSDSIQLQPNGLIQKSKRIVSFLDQTVNQIFRSTIKIPSKIPNQTAIIDSTYQGLIDPLIIFNPSGEPICAAISSAQQYQGPFTGAWGSATSSNSFPFSFPMCWDQSGHLTQGYFAVPWNKPYDFKMNGQTLTIRRDPLGGGSDQGTPIVMHSNGTIRWIDHVSGLQKIGKSLVPVTGPIKFRPDQTVECTRIKSKVQFENARGGIFKYEYSAGMSFELLCFNQIGQYEKTISVYEFNKLFVSDLFSFK